MTNPFGKPTTRIFSNHKFQVRPISMKALADDVPTAVIDVVEIPEDAPLTNDLPLLRICNPKVTTNELIALADSSVLGTARELLIFHPKLPLEKAVEIASLMEHKSWEYESSEEYLNSLSASDLESAIQDFDYDDEEVTYAGFTRDMAIRGYLSKNPKSMAYLEENAPNLLRKFDELVEAGLFKFYVMYSPITGNLGYDVIRYEHSGAALLTEFVRMKRDGDIDDEDAFSIADWDEDSEDEFDEFITELREAGFGDDGTTEAELGTALHLPNTYILDGITLESSFELSYSSFFISVLSDQQKGVVDFQDSNEDVPLVGVHGYPGLASQPPVLPLFNSLGELEMILIYVQYMSEGLDEVINQFIDPNSHYSTLASIPFYVGDIHCDGELIMGDGGWLIDENWFNEEALLLTDLPIDDYGVIAFFDNRYFDQPLAIALVRGQIKRKFQLIDAVYPEIRNSGLQDHIGKLKVK